MDFQEFKDAVVAQAQAMGVEEYELYYQVSEAVMADGVNRALDRFTADNLGGVCFRCIVDGKMGYAATELLSPEQAQSLVRKAVDNAAVLESDEPVFLAPGGQEYTRISRPTQTMPATEQLIARVLDAQQAVYDAHEAVTDGSITRGVCQKNYIAICNSKGLDLSVEHVLSAMMVSAVVCVGEEKANDFQIQVGPLEQSNLQALSATAAQTALSKLGGEPAPTGTYPVVFDPEAMSSLLDTFSTVFSAENARKGLSALAGKEGQVIASEAVTLVDDPCYPENPMPMPFDAEGSPTRKKDVICQGVLQTLLYDLRSASLAGKETTGNAAKSGYDKPLMISPFTMYLAPGQYTPEQLLEKAGKGVYIRTLSGLHAGTNPVTGDFSLQSEGYLIENGKKTTHVSAFTVAGNFYQMLKDITAVGKDLTLPSPTDMNTYGSPTVLVENLSVAGK